MSQRVTVEDQAHFYGSAQGNTTDPERVNTGAVLGRLLTYFAPFRTQLLGALVLVVISAVTQAVGPALIGRAIDVYITGKNGVGLVQIMLLLLAVYVVGFVSQYGQTSLIGSIGQRFLSALRTQIFDKVQSLSIAFFDQNKAGDLMSRLVNDIQVINQLLSQGVTQVIGSVFSLVGILIAMLVLNVPLALLSFVTVPLMVWITIIFARRSRNAFRDTRSVIGIVSSELEEELVGVRVAQAFNRTDANIEHFAAHNAVNRDVNVHAIAITSAFTPTIDIISTLATAIVAGFGGWLAINRTIPVGVVVAFFIYVQQFFRPIQIISSIYTQAQGALAGAERIFELVDEPVEQKDTPNAQPLPHIVGHVVYDQVNFAYNANLDKPEFVLHDISLDVKAGETIALVGETGAGKSSLVNLLTRFYDATSGRVMIDGYDVQNVTLASLRAQVGIVQQDTFLFSGSVADNIRYGRLDATDAEVEAAARTVSVHEFITESARGLQNETW